MWPLTSKPKELVTAETALPGRKAAITVSPTHLVTGAATTEPFAVDHAVAMFGFGCFWGAERRLWQQPGVVSTQVGYAGGITPNPTYEEVCSGRTGHTEVVRVVFDPAVTSLDVLVKVFWEAHDPTQGMRQGNDVGTQYRSAAYWYDDVQRAIIEASAAAYQAGLDKAGYGEITTDLQKAPAFYYAEDYHQQYLAKNPNGYCGLAGTGVSCPIGLGLATD